MGSSSSKSSDGRSVSIPASTSVFDIFDKCGSDHVKFFGEVGKMGNQSQRLLEQKDGVNIIQHIVHSKIDTPSKIRYIVQLSGLGVNVNAGGVYVNDTVLNQLIVQEEFDGTIALIQKLYTIISMQKCDVLGHNPLHVLMSVHTDGKKLESQKMLGRLLIKYGVQVNGASYEDRRTPVFYGIYANNTSLLENLFEFSPTLRIGINFMDAQGFTPLMFALLRFKDNPADCLRMINMLFNNTPLYINATAGKFTAQDCLNDWYNRDTSRDVFDEFSRKGAVTRSLLNSIAHIINTNETPPIDPKTLNTPSAKEDESRRLVTPAVTRVATQQVRPGVGRMGVIPEGEALPTQPLFPREL